MYVDWMGWTLDFTGPQMVLTIKLTTAAIDYYDGNQSASEKEVPQCSIKEAMSLLEH